MNQKLDRLKEYFIGLESAAVAFSGGVDSSVLAAVAFSALGDKMIAVTGISPSVPARDLESAVSFCKKRGMPHVIIKTGEFGDPNYLANPENRCFYCKKNLLESISAEAKKRGIKHIAEGTNSSELAGHRPGFQAKKEVAGVVTPFTDLSFGKEEVRELAKYLRLETAAKPANACLSSRIPTGEKIDAGALKRIDKAEDFLIALGIAQVRVRHHGNLARIETDEQGIGVCFANRILIRQRITELGWKHVTLDLGGYRCGGGMTSSTN